MKFQRQLGPVIGIAQWADLMQSAEMLTFMPSESRKQVPGSWISGAVDTADRTNFDDVRAVLLMLMLLFTFARSESPLPKTKDGKENFDPEKQLCLSDVRIKLVADKTTAQFRLKGIKQDTLGQRAAAQGEGDWVIVAGTGDTDRFDITMWLQLYFSFFSNTRPDDEPLFVDAPGDATPWIDSAALTACRELWARTPGVTTAEANTCGLHGLRVSGNVGVTRELGKEIAKAQGGWGVRGSESLPSSGLRSGGSDT